MRFERVFYGRNAGLQNRRELKNIQVETTKDDIQIAQQGADPVVKSARQLVRSARRVVNDEFLLAAGYSQKTKLAKSRPLFKTQNNPGDVATQTMVV